MSEILSVVLFAGCLGLTVASDYDNGGTCKIEGTLVMKSLQTGNFINGVKKVQMRGNDALYSKWDFEAGLGWFVIRNFEKGGMLDVEGGCDYARPGTKIILYNGETPQDNNKFVINSDGTIQSLCRDDLYLKGKGQELVLGYVDDPYTTVKDIRFTIHI